MSTSARLKTDIPDHEEAQQTMAKGIRMARTAPFSRRRHEGRLYRQRDTYVIFCAALTR